MKKITERIKDLIYDSIDYILILGIVLIVGGIIGWRLDILFANNIDKNTNSNEVNQQKTLEQEVEDGINEDNNSENNKENENNSTEENKGDSSNPTDVSKEIVINIPAGALPHQIANILMSNGIIKDKNSFLKRSEELGLDTKLRSGNYTLKTNSSLDNIIKTLSGKL